MIDKPQIEEICQKLGDAIPPAFKDGREKMQAQFKSILTSAFEKLDLVTREEFDAQCQVLHKTREKVEQLEATIKQKNS